MLGKSTLFQRGTLADQKKKKYNRSKIRPQ